MDVTARRRGATALRVYIAPTSNEASVNPYAGYLEDLARTARFCLSRHAAFCRRGRIRLFELAQQVMRGNTRALDEAILLALRNPTDPSEPISPRWFEEMM